MLAAAVVAGPFDAVFAGGARLGTRLGPRRGAGFIRGLPVALACAPIAKTASDGLALRSRNQPRPCA
jgi:hypothetical protein